MKILFFILLAFAPNSSFAEEVMTKKAFTDQLLGELPSILCSNRTIRECFISNNEKCSVEMKTSISTCIVKAGPTYTPQIKSSQAAQWVRELSACATQDFATRLAPLKKSTPQCAQ